MKCRICGNTKNNTVYEAREMMMGLRDVFTYFQCGECKCLQIAEIPDDLSKYYSGNYYSFQEREASGFFMQYLKRIRNEYALFTDSYSGKFLYNKYPEINLRSLSYLDLSKQMQVLDVGCGTGQLLQSLDQLGFENLTGIDPFNKKEIIKISERTEIHKKNIHELIGQWDLIMMHHAFEHMPDPLEVLQSCSRLLSPGGYCLIRIPVTQSQAWVEFRENWVQLDPPRHLYVHSPKSMQYLSNKADFKFYKTIYDSTSFQFWGSIQYKNDIPLRAEDSYVVDPGQSMFTKDDIKSFSQKADKLNKKKRGDQAIFILQKQT